MIRRVQAILGVLSLKTKAILDLAANVLAGEIAARSGQTDVAVRHFLAAVAEQDGHWFTEPPVWYFPVRQSLGARSDPLGRILFESPVSPGKGSGRAPRSVRFFPACH